jgi:zinc D-Ala-D-Ala dipeptidase
MIEDTIGVEVASLETINLDTSYIEYVFKRYDLVNIKSLDSTIQVDLRYSDTNNFLKYNLYDGLRNAYFNCETALNVCAAQYYLQQINPDLSLLILDASRPQHIQQMMWDSLKMHPDKKLFYLSKPEDTSLHNYGCAVDVTIINTKTDSILDMGTDFDFFGNLSEPIYETHFLKLGQLSPEAYKNRILLRKVMLRAKLNPITSEWWHFSLCKKDEAARKFQLIK